MGKAKQVYEITMEEMRAMPVEKIELLKKVFNLVIAPEQVTPEQVTPEQVTPKQVTPKQVTPEQVTPEQVTPEQVTPEQVTPEQVSKDKEQYTLLENSNGNFRAQGRKFLAYLKILKEENGLYTYRDENLSATNAIAEFGKRIFPGKWPLFESGKPKGPRSVTLDDCKEGWISEDGRDALIRAETLAKSYRNKNAGAARTSLTRIDFAEKCRKYFKKNPDYLNKVVTDEILKEILK